VRRESLNLESRKPRPRPRPARPTPMPRARPREPVSGPRIPETSESQDWSDLAEILALPLSSPGSSDTPGRQTATNPGVRTQPTGKPTGALFLQHLFRIQLQNSLCNLCNMSSDIAKQCQHFANMSHTLSQHLQHCRQTFATSRHIPTQVAQHVDMSAQSLTHTLHKLHKCRAHVCTCLHMSAKALQRFCKALQRLCKAPETPETPKSALQSLCRPENGVFGVFGVQTRKDPKPRNRPVWTPFASI
jgi:hypothetical protein